MGPISVIQQAPEVERKQFLRTNRLMCRNRELGRELDYCGMALDVTDEGRRCRTFLLISV
jgi:hypothetical protein